MWGLEFFRAGSSGDKARLAPSEHESTNHHFPMINHKTLLKETVSGNVEVDYLLIIPPAWRGVAAFIQARCSFYDEKNRKTMSWSPPMMDGALYTARNWVHEQFSNQKDHRA